MDEHLAFSLNEDAKIQEIMAGPQQIKADWSADAASVIVQDAAGRIWRLPRAAPDAERLGPGQLRGVREVVTERYLAQFAGIFYEVPRTDTKAVPNFRQMKPIAAHDYAISDFCTWRGLLVLAGLRTDAPPGERVAVDPEGRGALWFGQVDELWRLGKPVGVGGPWLDTPVQPGQPSDPYLMTGFDRKILRLRHDAAGPVRFQVEVDYSNRDYWKLYAAFDVPPGVEFVHEFPDGFSAHWVRVVADQRCRATAQLEYR